MARQLRDAMDDLTLLRRLDPGKTLQIAAPGSLILTDNGSFYLATAIGKIAIDGHEIIVLSPASPLGNKMTGLAAGARFEMNGRSYTIQSVN